MKSSLPGNASATTGISANSAIDILATLQQMQSGGTMFDAALSAGSASPPAYGVNTGNFAPAPPALPRNACSDAATTEALRRIAIGESSLGNSGLVSALTQIQYQVMSAAAGPDASVVVRDFIPGETPAATLNMLRAVKAQRMMKSISPIDVMTIDIVTMLFDYVFDDDAIPDAIKGLIARLQIPVLKVALLDRSFFSMKTHPARRLLDALADPSVCFAGAAYCDNLLYRMIETVVDRVHTEFETDMQIFADVLADLERFLAESESASAEFVEQFARVVNDREKRELARLIAHDETEIRVAHAELPAPVAAMIKGPWARVLERHYLREGGCYAGFVQALETVDGLIWSVMPKTNADERKRLVSMLPRLLKGLQQGLEIAAVETDDRGRFFSTLVDCHAAAVRAGLRGESVSAQLADAQPSSDGGTLFATLIDEEAAREAEWKNPARSGVIRIQFTDRGFEIEELAAPWNSACREGRSTETSEPDMPAPPSKSGDHHRAAEVLEFNITDKPVVELARGTWVEFSHSGDRRIRARLSWISPLNGIYLFTRPGAAEALAVVPDALQIQLRRGNARVIEKLSLVDRAVDKIVNSLSEAAHA
jgi:hypothetical protein